MADQPDATALRGDDIPAEGVAVGVDLGGTNIQIGAVGADGAVLSRAKRKTGAREGMESVLERVAGGIEEACGDIGMSVSDLSAVGIGAPGPVDPKNGVVIEAVNLRWNDAPVASWLTDRLGVRVFLDNDVNVAVYGEYRLGAGRGARDMIGAWIGTGVGGALILAGKPFYGHWFSAGEIGHIDLYPGAAPGSRSLEHTCSRSSLVRRITNLIGANRESILPELVDGNLQRVKSKTLAEAYRRGDPLTMEVVDDAAARLGGALGNLVTVLSLERVVLGGGLTEAIGEPYIKAVERAVKATAFPAPCKQVDVVASTLEDDAGVIGAALIAFDRLGV